jgi:hypothetical protein
MRIAWVFILLLLLPFVSAVTFYDFNPDNFNNVTVTSAAETFNLTLNASNMVNCSLRFNDMDLHNRTGLTAGAFNYTFESLIVQENFDSTYNRVSGNWSVGFVCTGDNDTASSYDYPEIPIYFDVVLPNVTAINLSPTPTGASDDLTASFTCLDGHSACETNYWVNWFVNDSLAAEGNLTLFSGNYTDGHYVIASIKVSDTYVNSSWENSTARLIGDNVSPVLYSYGVSPDEIEVTESVTLTANCTDNEAVESISWKLYDPSLNTVVVQGDSGAEKQLSTIGEWQVFEVICTDFGGNTDTSAETTNITVTEKQLFGGGGGGGSKTVLLLPFGDGDFDIKPSRTTLNEKAGTSKLVEITIQNDNAFDIGLTVCVDEEQSGLAYDWISFEGFKCVRGLEVPLQAGLESGQKFLRFQVDIPDDAIDGEYTAVLLFEGEVIKKFHIVEVFVGESRFSGAFDWLSYEVFSFGGCSDAFSSADVCSATAIVNVRVWHLALVAILILGVLLLPKRKN